MYWPARKPETLLQRAVYKFHPRFRGGDFTIWWGDSRRVVTAPPLEGGDVMPIGKGVVLVGMGERTTRQAVLQVAPELFAQGGATRVIACLMPKSRAAMHLDTVFTFCDRDLCTSSAKSPTRSAATARARPRPGGVRDPRGQAGICFDVVRRRSG